MKKAVILTTVLWAVFLFSPCAQGFLGNKIDKANSLIKIDRYEEASKLLYQAVIDNPSNAKVQFQAGLAYLKMNETGEADRCFRAAVKLNPAQYKKEVVKTYMSLGYASLKNGNIGKAKYEFAKAADYDPAVCKKFAEDLFFFGKDHLAKAMESKAYEAFSAAHSLDNSFGAAISESYFKAGKNATSNRDLLYRRASEFSSKYNQEIGQFYVRLAKTKGHNEGENNRAKNEAKKLLSKEEYEKEFPPPSWKTVYSKTFVGVGFTGGDDKKDNDGSIFTAMAEKDVIIGDRVTVIDSDFEIWDRGAWQKCQSGEWITVNTIQTDKNITVRNDKGKKFTVVVQRFM
jgi:tetratricopeptide (TPR) repeat protein